MDESLLAGFELDLCADGQDIDDLAEDNIADLDIADDAVNNLLCLLRRLCIGAGNEYSAVILNINFNARLCDNAVDGLAAGADNLANLIGIDGELKNTGCEG